MLTIEDIVHTMNGGSSGELIDHIPYEKGLPSLNPGSSTVAVDSSGSNSSFPATLIELLIGSSISFSLTSSVNTYFASLLLSFVVSDTMSSNKNREPCEKAGQNML